MGKFNKRELITELKRVLSFNILQNIQCRYYIKNNEINEIVK